MNPGRMAYAPPWRAIGLSKYVLLTALQMNIYTVGSLILYIKNCLVIFINSQIMITIIFNLPVFVLVTKDWWVFFSSYISLNNSNSSSLKSKTHYLKFDWFVNKVYLYLILFCYVLNLNWNHLLYLSVRISIIISLILPILFHLQSLVHYVLTNHMIQ